MTHVLDNPPLNALISGNKALSAGSGNAHYFAADVSPFAGIEGAGFDDLPANRVFAVFSDGITIPDDWKILNQLVVLQMVFEKDEQPEADNSLVLLQDNNIPAMLELTKLTNPGPFFSRTIDFGNYYGIFDDGQLVSMAGQRMQPLPYVEISAVCNHPAHLGKGYASRLIHHQIRLIRAAGHIPFLHVRSDNKKAIKVYQTLGFTSRKELTITTIQKK